MGQTKCWILKDVNGSITGNTVHIVRMNKGTIGH